MSQNMAQGGQTPLWNVTRIEDQFGPVSVGGSNRIKRVYFQIMGGNQTYVDVPFSSFNAATVAAAIETHVADVGDVLQLKGQSY